MFFMKIEIKDIIYINKIGKWILLLLPLFLFSCTEDSNGTGSVDSDGTAIIRLTVRPNDATQVTRTSSSTESKVSNLYILVFNSSGKVVGTKYSSTTDTTVSITTRQGTNYTIYAVANTGNSAFFQGVGTLTQFKKMLTTVDVNTYPLMCGSLSGQSVSQSSVTIGGLKLTRLFAKVTLNVTAATGITITGYQFCNVATSAYLNRDTVAGITWGNKTAVTASSISGVKCYMYGNPQGTVTHTDQIYKTQSAPSNASYILITAKGYNSSYTSTYKIYLGSDNSSDYNVYRNYSYTYNITLNNLYGGADTRVTISNISATNQTASNCYILNPGGNSIGIPVSRANEDGTTRLSSTTSGWTCGLLWTDNSNVLSSSGAVASIIADVANGRIIVTSGTASGNAVIYVKDSSGNIAWSWHIWVTSYNPNTTNETINGFVWMDRNLGAQATATGVAGNSFDKCGGLFYEWGRKDPFPQCNTSIITSSLDDWTTVSTGGEIPIYGFNMPDYSKDNLNTNLIPNCSYIKRTDASSQPILYVDQLLYSIKYPLLFFSNWTGSKATQVAAYSEVGGMNSWGGEYNQQKSVYDPCPYGWRVPSGKKSSSSFVSPWSSWVNSPAHNVSNYAMGSWNNGTSGYYPAQGVLGWSVHTGTTSYIRTGDGIYVWTASLSQNTSHPYAIHINFGNNMDSGYAGNDASAGFAVRCVKDQ